MGKMKRLTDVDICIEKIKQLPISYDAETVQRCIEVLSNAPTIEAEPVRHGKWVLNPSDALEAMFAKPKCSECGFESADGGDYCSNCGARMDEE